MSAARVWRIGVAVTDCEWAGKSHIYGLKRYFWTDTVPMTRREVEALCEDIRQGGWRVLTVREAQR